ncbi:GNAT family N-acetyltransferase [Agromyces ramosus]|uniref:GNAT superfamily N-acetyltransferase n=1 Tax=Agromyces ramosus TaxID=33879 RepID=A0ABU0R7N5_9MICO|nr:GNAT family N-acetyltransferase [Agromyces ramosus]MDQ0894107.1 GNAT superfamily N-acetyltransferase [Agromyces ramosus]
MPITIDLLPEASAADDALVERLAGLVNSVYETSEAGLWVADARRTNERDLAELIRRGQVGAATTDGVIVGAVQVRQFDDTTGLFGMLVADPERRGEGIGRELVAFTERWARERGLTAMQLELLVPRAWSHPSKQFLQGWYERIGYRVVRTTSLDERYPELAPQLATECDLLIYRKDLPG